MRLGSRHFDSSQLFCRERWVYEGGKDKPYLIAKEPGSVVKVEVVVGVMGRVRITYLKSKTFGLGDIWCWLDDDREGGKKVVSWWQLENLCAVPPFYHWKSGYAERFPSASRG
jgi:hypothetical protein